MAEEVSINMSVFRSNLSKLKSSVANIEINQLTQSFSKTNIEPFTKDVENAAEAIKLLEKYKHVLEADAVTLEDTGEKLREKDEELSAQVDTDIACAPPNQ
ncbi:hypothetical protein J416_11562 [Gracilibacillus halophilus YIM-C55.5]|uniref:Uncharacterized protein n=1 Tax=Gracilibacillus halophilus YIM-C55.5 TaxID=1308866 RepID=N4WJG9_9BACI|nr:TIGR04197 family type VII secretion effector [Gracilibacillus halophilus]ENH96307.1 hypothetical protein J416_11562 [Gracilibacillus halophilus YIM-C55.5]